MRHQTGYTLLELLVVLVIISLLAAAVPGLTIPGVNSMRSSAKVQRFVYDLRAAHDRAIETGKTVALQVSALEGQGILATTSRSSTILFFSDGSVSGNTIRLSSNGHSKTLEIDPMTGRVSSP